MKDSFRNSHNKIFTDSDFVKLLDKQLKPVFEQRSKSIHPFDLEMDALFDKLCCKIMDKRR